MYELFLLLFIALLSNSDLDSVHLNLFSVGFILVKMPLLVARKTTEQVNIIIL